MKIETQYLEDHKAKLNVEIEADLVEASKRRAARRIASRIKIPGFRPGKAPYPVIVRQVGEANILEEAIELLIEEQYPKIIDEADIRPYGPGSLENVASMDPLILEFIVPLMAEVTLGDYRSLSKPHELPQVEEKDVENVLSDLRQRQAVIEPVDRPAQEGDVVTARLSAKRGSAPEGEETELISERSLSFIVRSEDGDDTMGSSSDGGEDDEVVDEWPFPGFSRHLIGLSVNDEGAASYQFSEDVSFEALRGADAEFRWVVESVKARTLPEVNDEFAASLGEYENVEALRADIRASLQSQAEESYNEQYDDEILQQAVEQAAFKYPPEMLDREVDEVIERLESRLRQQNMDLDLYLKVRDLDMEGLRTEALPVAESRLKKSLLLLELAEAEELQVEQEELQSETTSAINRLANTLTKDEARRLNDQNVYRSLVSNIMVDLLSQRALTRLREICSGKLEEESAISTTENGAVDSDEEIVEAAITEDTKAAAIEAEGIAELQIQEGGSDRDEITETTGAPDETD